MKLNIAVASLLLVAAGGCSTSKQRADAGPTPAQVVASGEARAAVHWGGQIVKVRNLRDRTLVEVLALPLESSGRPQVDAKPEGRFIIERAGFLEPREYAANRLVEVRGQLNGFASGSVGEAAYRYPVVMGEQLVLWPDEIRRSPSTVSPRINFGVGVGSHGSGVGVGVGF